ncbi:MAG: ankyrin repeat domain-containing protein [Pirellulales bacterium]
MNESEVIARLCDAIERDDVNEASSILEGDLTPAICKDDQGNSLLHLAQSDVMMKFLLCHDIDPDIRDTNGWTPLFLFSYLRRSDIAVVLLQAGCSIDLQTNDGDTALMAAVDNEDGKMTELLLSHGANPNVSDTDAWTPLFVAASLNNAGIAQMLLVHGANPNIQAVTTGQAPLHYAVSESNVELVRLLVRHGARHDVTDNCGMVPLDYASNEAVMRVLRGEMPTV